jgi:hypothetical protein
MKNTFQFIYFKCAAQTARDILNSLVRGNKNDNNLPELICSLYRPSFYHATEVETVWRLVVFQGIIDVRHIATCFQTVVLTNNCCYGLNLQSCHSRIHESRHISIVHCEAKRLSSAHNGISRVCRTVFSTRNTG